MAETLTISRDGYGQVEPNHLSAPRNGHIYAQLSAAPSIEILEQGMFVKYDYANEEVNFTGKGSWYMVYNEEKLYDERKQLHKHYAMKKSDFYEDEYKKYMTPSEFSAFKFMTPRVFAIEAGDIWTTNMVKEKSGTTPIAYQVGWWLKVGTDGILEPDTAANAATNPAEPIDGIRVVKLFTMPDGQNGLKLQATQNL